MGLGIWLLHELLAVLHLLLYALLRAVLHTGVLQRVLSAMLPWVAISLLPVSQLLDTRLWGLLLNLRLCRRLRLFGRQRCAL